MIAPIPTNAMVVISRLATASNTVEYAPNSNRIKLPLQNSDIEKLDFLLPNENLPHMPLQKHLQSHTDHIKVVTTSDKFSGLYQLCKLGLGAAPIPTYVAEHCPDLLPVLDVPEKFQKNEIWILTHPDIKNTARIKAFMDFMRNEIQSEKSYSDLN